MKRAIGVLFAVMVVMFGTVSTSAAETTAPQPYELPYWDGWKVTSSQASMIQGVPYYSLTAPADTYDKDEILFHVVRLVEACLQHDGVQYEITLSYPFYNITETEVDEMEEYLTDCIKKLYGYGDSYVSVTSSVGRQYRDSALRATVSMSCLVRYNEDYYELLDALPEPEDTEALIRYLYSYLRENIKYRKGYYGGSISALRDGYAVCEGYSQCVLDVCREVGIPCLFLDSTVQNHAWNAVYVNGEWKQLDVTNNHVLVDRIFTNRFFGGEETDLVCADLLLNPFVDVSRESYYHDAVLWAYEGDVTTGTGAGKFSPELTCTRGQVVTFLWRAQGCPEPVETGSPFTDVTDPNAYYYKAVLWAAEKGITSGTGGDIFDLDSTLTYEQILTFLCRAAGGDTSGDWAQKAINWAREKGLVDGLSFSGKDNCPRADVVYFLWKQII